MTAIWWFLYGQLLVLLFLGTIVIELLLKTHAKAAQTAARANLIAPVAKTANQANTAATAAAAVTTVIAANASFLATISQQPAPAKAGGDTTPTSGSPGTTYSQAYLTALATNLNTLLNYVNNLASDVNGIYDALQSANIFS